jgi:hypothetical protein
VGGEGRLEFALGGVEAEVTDVDVQYTSLLLAP